jgi:hypothetical protein
MIIIPSEEVSICICFGARLAHIAAIRVYIICTTAVFALETRKKKG